MFALKNSLFACGIIVFFSCKKEQRVHFSELNNSTENNTIVSVICEKADGNSMVANRINASIDSIIGVNLHIGEPGDILKKPLKESIASFDKEYRNFKTNFPESAQEWDAQIDGEHTYQSSELISYALTSYTNTGGAHGNYIITFINFNPETGQIITNEELFTDKSKFIELAEKKFNSAVENIADYYFEEDVFSLPANIGFNEKGIVLLYNASEIAPYSIGITEFTIPFKEALNHLRPLHN